MAINKTINKSTKSHGAMRNCIEYVLRENKTRQELIYVTGPFAPEQINYDTVYKAFLDEKKLWNKDSSRMYNHNIISWHKEEAISLEEAYEFGKEFAEKCFEGFQTLVSVHKDRDHVHVHLVTNTVSFEDGHKLHSSKKDMERMKEFTNEMCLERGLTVAQKGKDFYGQPLEEGHVRAWSKDKYHLLQNEGKKSYVVECALAVLEVKEQSCSREEFIKGMEQRGWQVNWTSKRKNITFINDEGKKVRDSNLNKTFNMKITKEALLNEFERQAENRRLQTAGRTGEEREQDPELERYYREVQEAIAGTVEGNTDFAGADIGFDEEWQGRGSEEDTEAFLADLRNAERASEQERDNHIAERNNREAERERQSAERERAAKEAEQRIARERAEHKERSRGRGRSR